MDIPFDSSAAREININIFETIYHGALEASCEISKTRCDDILKLKKNKNQWKFMETFSPLWRIYIRWSTS